MEDGMEAIIQVMESALGARDPYTVGHQQRVTLIACAIARELGLPAVRFHYLRVAATLHDLGKIAIPGDILAKPGRLTDLEFALIKRHPQVGCEILKPLNLPIPTTMIILQHHERLDGSGYPLGLKGEDILLEARILGVADVLEAMCSHRPYRSALGLDLALEEISQNRGILYDPAVVAACLKLYGDKRGQPHPFGPPAEENRAASHDLRENLAPLALGKPGGKSALPTLRRFLASQPRFLIHVFIAMILGGTMLVCTWMIFPSNFSPFF
jgi:putative nucleotidyltransferase with HDIG domain